MEFGRLGREHRRQEINTIIGRSEEFPLTMGQCYLLPFVFNSITSISLEYLLDSWVKYPLTLKGKGMI